MPRCWSVLTSPGRLGETLQADVHGGTRRATVGLHRQRRAAVVTVDTPARVQVSEGEVSGVDGGDVRVGVQVRLQVVDGFAVTGDGEGQRRLGGRLGRAGNSDCEGAGPAWPADAQTGTADG
jgi:hypothetical protein